MLALLAEGRQLVEQLGRFRHEPWVAFDRFDIDLRCAATGFMKGACQVASVQHADDILWLILPKRDARMRTVQRFINKL